MKSRQGTATASAAVTCLIFEGTTDIKFTCTGQAGTMAENYSRICALWEFSTIGSSELTTTETLKLSSILKEEAGAGLCPDCVAAAVTVLEGMPGDPLPQQ